MPDYERLAKKLASDWADSEGTYWVDQFFDEEDAAVITQWLKDEGKD